VNEVLLAEIDRRLRLEQLAPEVCDLVLTAVLAPEELSHLTGDRAPRRPGTRDLMVPPPTPAKAYLDSVTVEGFRGIGPSLRLPLAAGPGLTLVIGRNGTGKSSLSDALEVLLTGNSARWAARKNRAWLEGWRNLHHAAPTTVEARLVIEEQPGFTTVTRRWEPDAEFTDSTVSVSRPGQPRAGFDVLGWEEALTTYRPFLPYSELGGMLDEGPSRLFDALNAILGLEDLSAAERALADARLTLERHARVTEEELAHIRPRLETSTDPRAADVLVALAKRTPDLKAVAAAVGQDVGTSTGDDDLDRLRRIAAIELPGQEELTSVADRLRAAADAVDALAATDAGRARHTAELLAAAVAFHRRHGDGDCPVCRRPGALSGTWRAEAETEEARLRRLAREADAAHQQLTAAEQHARTLLRPPPAALAEVERAGIDLDSDDLLARWRAWSEGPAVASPEALAAHLVGAASLRNEVALVAGEAAARVATRESAWRPVAGAVAVWLDRATEDRRAGPIVKELKAAEIWIKQVEAEIRAERFEPIGKAATEVWQALRMRSSVDIGGIRLAGGATRRRVEVHVTVDGSGAAALGVMSQGELHALALSLFLPRATLPESPFRFVIIDDPVQAMDPARVEGLAKVLAATAGDHQVIVLTHDDRLPEAVRRLDIDATVIEVTRGEQSAVRVEKCLDPVDRRVRDARAVARSADLPESVRARVVPTLCRQALEAACIETVRRRRLGRGDPHDEVEVVIGGAHKLYPLAALALFDDADQGAAVLTRLNNWGPSFADTFRACNRGAHEPHVGHLPDLVDAAAELARRIRALP